MCFQRSHGCRTLRLALVVAGVLTGPAVADQGDPAAPDTTEAPGVGADGTLTTEGEPSSSTVPDGYGETIDVRDRASELIGRANSATAGHTGRADLAERPILRPGELLETVPGLVITQHSGDGKANQYFLRGFNLDHGTDFRINLDGVPINMPTHGHGQGYADLTPMIPELVDHVAYQKGPYDAAQGDFASAGAASLELVDELPNALLLLSPGENGYGRALVADSHSWASGERGATRLLGAVEVVRNDGPWENDQNYRKYNGLLRLSQGDSGRGFAATLSGYSGEWDSTDQIPLQAIADGEVDRFGALDPSDGGDSSRYALTGAWWRGGSDRLTTLRAYAVRYELSLFSNFTYFLDDEENGDQFEQVDRRTVLGFDLRQERALAVGRDAQLRFGLQGRYDDIANGLHQSRERARLSTTREDDVEQLAVGPWVDLDTRWNNWFRSTVGLRADYWQAEVASDLTVNSGSRDDVIVSPKLSLIFGPWSKTELYLNVGSGFHSNDARGATIRVDPASGETAQRVDPLVQSTGLDLGVRSELIENYQTALSLFALDIDSELLFVGDAGATEASRPSRRLGIEWQNFWSPKPWLRFDADLAFSRARFRDDAPEGDYIPGSIERVVSAGVAVDNLAGWFGSLRLRYFGPRSLVEDDSVRSPSSTLVYARLGYSLPRDVEVGIEVYNLFDQAADDIAYYYESRSQPGAPAREGIHIHPAEPRTVRLVVSWSP